MVLSEWFILLMYFTLLYFTLKPPIRSGRINTTTTVTGRLIGPEIGIHPNSPPGDGVDYKALGPKLQPGLRVPAEKKTVKDKNKFSMFDSSERLTSRLLESTQLAPKALQNWSQIFFEKILIEQETAKCVPGLAGSTVCIIVT